MICALQEGDLNSQMFTSAELALLKFAGKVNANSPPVTRADVEAAMRAGWTEAQVAEAVHIAGLFAAFNRIANGFGLPSPYPDGCETINGRTLQSAETKTWHMDSTARDCTNCQVVHAGLPAGSYRSPEADGAGVQRCASTLTSASPYFAEAASRGICIAIPTGRDRSRNTWVMRLRAD